MYDVESINKQIVEYEKEAYQNIKKEVGEKYFSMDVLYNREFVEFLVNFCNLKNKYILDYGCGLGAFSKLLSCYSTNVYGCDISVSQLSFAKKMAKGEVKFFADDFFKTSLKNNSFDFIFCRNLGPLVKMDYCAENVKYLKQIISSLREDGIAYFILTGNLSGIPGDRLGGFQNHKIVAIYRFFSQAGYVSMVNVLDYQTVVITKTENLGARLNEKMYIAINYMLKNLRKYDEMGYMKCKVWLFLNRDINVKKGDFKNVDSFVEIYIYPLLIGGLCWRPSLRRSSDGVKYVNGPIYFLSGDQELYFKKYYAKEMFIYSTTIKGLSDLFIPQLILRIKLFVRNKIRILFANIFKRKEIN